MEYIYVLVHMGGDWEDMIIFVSKEEAIDASKKNPYGRVEIFKKNEVMGYSATYNFYKNGELIVNRD